ncbi:MAG: AAA family ATPase [Angelakisella sp.]
MTKIIAIANQKGGVGKTTTTMSLGAALARKGKKVLLVDLDPQGNLSEYLGYEPDGLPTVNELLLSAVGAAQGSDGCIHHNDTEQLDYIPATLALSNADMVLITAMNREMALRRSLEQDAFQEYDYILIDCLPSLGILTVNAFTAANSVIVPVQAQKFAVDGLGALINVLKLVQRQINPSLRLEGIVRTMQDRTNMSKAVGAALMDEYGDLVYNTAISRSTEAANSTYRKQSLTSYNNKLGTEYEQLADELLAREVISK